MNSFVNKQVLAATAAIRRQKAAKNQQEAQALDNAGKQAQRNTTAQHRPDKKPGQPAG